MGVPILTFVVALAAGSVLTARWLPDTGSGPVGTIALAAVSGLVGITCALVAVHVCYLVQQLDQSASLDVSGGNPEIVSNAILSTLRDAGPVIGLAAVAYLLAPGSDDGLTASRDGAENDIGTRLQRGEDDGSKTVDLRGRS